MVLNHRESEFRPGILSLVPASKCGAQARRPVHRIPIRKDRAAFPWRQRPPSSRKPM